MSLQEEQTARPDKQERSRIDARRMWMLIALEQEEQRL